MVANRVEIMLLRRKSTDEDRSSCERAHVVVVGLVGGYSPHATFNTFLE